MTGTANRNPMIAFKKKVVLSSYCYGIMALAMILICSVFVYTLKQPDNDWVLYLLSSFALLLLLIPLFFAPRSIALDDNSLSIICPLRTRSIPLAEIADVRLCAPTMGAIRTFGCAGWFGYYGWFRENDIGRYFAYYGKASDCFLVTLKNGRKYMLGCKDAPEMTGKLKNKLA